MKTKRMSLVWLLSTAFAVALPCLAQDGKAADDVFIADTAEFSVGLFKRTATGKENSLISPVSVLFALTMAANGADGDTLAQMEKALGGTIPLADRNRHLSAYMKGLPSEAKSKLHLANSVWIKEKEKRVQVNPDFIKTKNDYFGAKGYRGAFGTDTLKKINQWASTSTDGMIDKVLDEINPLAVMLLINAVAFDAEWNYRYTKNNIGKHTFANINGQTNTVDFMLSKESCYLKDGNATGFVKPYYNRHYSFVALLPNEGVPMQGYIASLTGAGFVEMLKKGQDAEVTAALPKFAYGDGITLNDTLKALGMTDAFDVAKADFSKMATMEDGNIFISEVLQKTFIKVDERGTRAAAATGVFAAFGSPPKKTVILGRPFVYAIVDNATRLPVFLGVVVRL